MTNMIQCLTEHVFSQVERHNGKTQERHSQLYGMMSNNIVLVEAAEVRTVSAV